MPDPRPGTERPYQTDDEWSRAVHARRTGAAWQHKPTFYIVGSNDRTIQPELQRFLAARMKAKVTEVASSHVPMLSQPQRVYDVIVDTAASVGR